MCATTIMVHMRECAHTHATHKRLGFMSGRTTQQIVHLINDIVCVSIFLYAALTAD